MMKHFCGEISYLQEHVPGKESVHSDICWHHDEEMTDEFKKFAHDCLDEWLNKSNGTGRFCLGEPFYISSELEYTGDEL